MQSTEAVTAMDISIVVPVYRAENSLRMLHQELTTVLGGMNVEYEIIFVEDNGGDRSWSVIKEIVAEDNHVTGVKLSRNFGQHAATMCGIARARGDWIFTLDDDLEQLPEFIPQIYEKAQQGVDLVYGVYTERTHRMWRNITSNLARWMFRMAIPNINEHYTSYRCIRRETARELTNFDSPFPFIDGYLSWITNNYTTVQVTHGERVQGRSSYTLGRLFAHVISIFVTFSDLPLRLASWLGLFMSFIGSIWFAVIILGRVFGLITVSGFASIMGGIVLFGGVQLLILGIIGQYLGRMNFRLSKKPLYLIGEEISGD